MVDPTDNLDIRWYVMQVMSNQEEKVLRTIRFECSKDAANLADDSEEARENKFRVLFNGLLYGIYELNIPFERIKERKPGKKEAVRDRKLYPGYVLVRMALYDMDQHLIPQNWMFVKNINGVIGLIGGQTPVPLTEDEVYEMTRRQEAEEGGTAKPKIQYQVGEKVILREGAFENCEAQIESIDEIRGRLNLSVSLFGRVTPVRDVEFWQVERPT